MLLDVNILVAAHRADHAAMDAVVGKMTDQLRPHLDAGFHALGRDLDELQA